MTDNQGTAGGTARAHLHTGAFDARIDSSESHRLDPRPGRQEGRHVDPGGVAGHLVAGAITFQVAGRIGRRPGIPGSPTVRRTA